MLRIISLSIVLVGVFASWMGLVADVAACAQAATNDIASFHLASGWVGVIICVVGILLGRLPHIVSTSTAVIVSDDAFEEVAAEMRRQQLMADIEVQQARMRATRLFVEDCEWEAAIGEAHAREEAIRGWGEWDAFTLARSWAKREATVLTAVLVREHQIQEIRKYWRSQYEALL